MENTSGETGVTTYVTLYSKTNSGRNLTESNLQQHPLVDGSGSGGFCLKMFLFTPTEPSVSRVGVSRIFNTSSSKHCSTLTRVFALHSIKRHPYSRAKSIPSFLLTTRSLSLSTLLPTSILMQSGFVEYKSISLAHISERFVNVSRRVTS